MKFSCRTQDLLEGLQLCGRAISKQQALPILGNVLMQVEGKRCTLSGTNLELSIITSFEAKIENEGGITVPLKAILNFIQYNQDEEVLLETSEGTHLLLKSKHAKAKISGEAVGEYPTIAPIEKETSFTLSPKPLLEALNLVTFACAKTTSRPVLSGVFIRTEKEKLVLVATDSYRLSEFKLPIDGLKGDISCIVPAKVLEELRAVLSGKTEEVDEEGEAGDEESSKKKKADSAKKVQKTPLEINLSSQQIEVKTGTTRLLSRLIDGKFPNYEQILPKEKKTTVDVSGKDIFTAVKRMHYFAKEMNNNITFSIDGEHLKLSTQETQLGRDESVIDITKKGTDNKIALSSSYVIDFLSHAGSDGLEIELSDKMHPAVFRIPGNDKFLHLIMPLRMTEE